jgi:ADP-heptose:LPS heptosyltransferase
MSAPRKLLLKCPLSPGDVMTMTVAVESLHTFYPGKFVTDVQTTAMEIWDNNPHVTRLPTDDPAVTVGDMQYPLIHRSGREPVSFLQGYSEWLGDFVGLPLRPCINRPCLYLSHEELGWMDQIAQYFTRGQGVPFWIVNAGIKADFTAKQWPIEYYQEVINRTRDRIQWVQIGQADHDHPKLDNVIDLRGMTTTRELIRLVYHSRGGIGPATFLKHLCAAFDKPYLCLLGGRESVSWVTYPKQVTFHTIGQLSCCRNGACWKSKVLRPDGDNGDSWCEQPVVTFSRPVGRCMAMIKPDEILAVLHRYLSQLT